MSNLTQPVTPSPAEAEAVREEMWAGFFAALDAAERGGA